jgi:Xaa-Pro aminopeptidase
MRVRTSLPLPEEFASAPTTEDLERWRAADHGARPNRLAALRSRAAEERLDALLLTSHADARYFSGMEFGPNEEPVAGSSGWLLVSGDDLAVLVDSRYAVQARREAPLATALDYGSDAGETIGRWLVAHGVQRCALDPQAVRHAVWERIAATATGVELVPVKGFGGVQRARKEPAEFERITAACAVADRALARILPQIRPGATEAALAWSLERGMREDGAEALAFDVAALTGGNAALPHGSPGARELVRGEVILFDFGAQVAGYRSDMTRTLFVGAASDADLALYEQVHRGQAATVDLLRRAISGPNGVLPSGRSCDEETRRAMGAGVGIYDHGLGHGIGLQTHEAPSLSRAASTEPLPSTTVFSVEPGIYLEDQIGIRIEDLVAVDATKGTLELLTRFPSDPIIVG